MQCSKCNNELREGATFCDSCGEKQIQVVDDMKTVDGLQAIDNTPPTAQAKKPKSIVGIVLASVVLVVGVAFMVNGISKLIDANKEPTIDEQIAVAGRAREALERSAEINQENIDLLEQIRTQQALIATLTRGTPEWERAVAENNRLLREAIRRMPELEDFIVTY